MMVNPPAMIGMRQTQVMAMAQKKSTEIWDRILILSDVKKIVNKQTNIGNIIIGKSDKSNIVQCDSDKSTGKHR